LHAVHPNFACGIRSSLRDEPDGGKRDSGGEILLKSSMVTLERFLPSRKVLSLPAAPSKDLSVILRQSPLRK
jgi:hypothetical protein